MVNKKIRIVIVILLFSILAVSLLIAGRLTGFVSWPSAPRSPSSPGEIAECIDNCSAGERICSGNGFKSCGDYNEDGCLEFGNLTLCSSGQKCTNGVCIAEKTSCKNECSAGARECYGSGYRICESDSLGCLKWGSYGCGGDEKCINGNCVPRCGESDWQSSLSPKECPSSGKQNRTWSKIGTCEDGIVKPEKEGIACNYQKPVCSQFTYSEWGDCGGSNIQTRTILSKLPENCEGGEAILSRTCNYVPFCTENQTISCDAVENGVVSGYKSKCKNNNWTNENTCKSECNPGFIKNFDRCILASEPREISGGSIKIEKSENRIVLKNNNTNKTILSIENLTDESKIRNIKITRSNMSENKEYVIINNLTLESSQRKTVYLEKKNQSSNAVCIADREVSNLGDILKGSVYCIKCPGDYTGYTSGPYEEFKCEIEENVLIISGLRHSGVVEDYMYCGDGLCASDEGCSSCPSDCGVCPIGTGNPGGGGSSGARQVYDNSGQANRSIGLTNGSPRISTGSGNHSPSLINNNSGSSGIDRSGDASYIRKVIGNLYFIVGLAVLALILVITLTIRKKSRQNNAENQKTAKDSLSDDSEINFLLAEGEKCLGENNLEGAKEIYNKISRIYDSSKTQEVYNKLLEFYNEIEQS
jgi:hypothetical protein